MTVTFGLGALILSLTMAAVAYFTTRQIILHQREQAILGQVRGNATAVASSLPSTPAPAIPQLLTQLDASAGSRSVLWVSDHNPGSQPVPGPNATPSSGTCYFAVGQISEQCDRALPPVLLDMVISGTPAQQHVAAAGSVQLVMGVPLPNSGAAYFAWFDLSEESRTLQILALALGAGALFTTLAGAVIGRWASGRLLRPLAQVSNVAETIAGGRLETRLAQSRDRDLAPLSASFNRMADALQERIEREVRFASDVSHELRSPLTTLATSLGVVERHAGEMAPRGRQALDLLAAELRRFQQMVDDLLEISRMDTGAADFSPEEVRVGELVRQAATTGSARGIPTAVDPAVEDLRVMVDKRRIDRVISNLVTNAARYAGGAVLLGAEPGSGDDSSPPATLGITGSVRARAGAALSGATRASRGSSPAPGKDDPSVPPKVRLVVVDHGPGVLPEERQRIFERFYRGQAAGQRGASDGTGLGLALVAEHVRLHGGKVWVEPGSHGENRFVVELPVIQSHPATPPYEQPDGEPAHGEDCAP